MGQKLSVLRKGRRAVCVRVCMRGVCVCVVCVYSITMKFKMVIM